VSPSPSARSVAFTEVAATSQGQQNTGGYSVQITAIERNGDQLVVRARFGVPDPGGMVTQVLTSPAHVVSIAAADATGVHEAILIDSNGAEHIRINTT